MNNEIIVGYDGTGCGHAALDLACDLAKGLGSKLVIAYGYQPYQGAGEIGTQREIMRDQGQAFVDEGWIWQNIKVPDYMHFDTGFPSRPRTDLGTPLPKASNTFGAKPWTGTPDPSATPPR